MNTLFQIIGIACLSWVLTHFELIIRLRKLVPADNKLWLLPFQIVAKIMQCTKCTSFWVALFWFPLCYFLSVTFHQLMDKLFLAAITCVVAEFINIKLFTIKIK